MRETFLYLAGLLVNAIMLWFAFFAIRRKYELDYVLDRTATIVRWTVIVIGLGITLLPGKQIGLIRLFGAALFVTFLAWPNFAYHHARLRSGEPYK
jgi:hypothetical protein